MNLERQIDYFNKNYSFITQYVLHSDSPTTSIGDRYNRLCRYCKKARPEVTFRKKAHSVPELIGNKWLVSYDECDVCNELFSQVAEDDFGKYLGAYRTIAQIKGKKDVPTYKANNKKSRVDMEALGLKITSYEDDPICDLNPESRVITITARRQPYTPMGVFKCFVKMAVAVCPGNEVEKLSHLTSWIREPRHTFESFPYKPLKVFQQFTPGPEPYTGISIFLLKRIENADDVPYMQFIIAFANLLFQIILPMPHEDQHLVNKPIKLVRFPVPFQEGYEYGDTQRKFLDLSGTEIVRDDAQVLTMHFDSAAQNDLPSS